jgi:hypothetical protein
MSNPLGKVDGGDSGEWENGEMEQFRSTLLSKCGTALKIGCKQTFG